MPRPGPRRQAVALRLDDELIVAVDTLAEQLEVNRSEAIRVLILEALAQREELASGYAVDPRLATIERLLITASEVVDERITTAMADDLPVAEAFITRALRA